MPSAQRAVQVGDRVVIDNVTSIYDRVYIGRIGTVRRINRRYSSPPNPFDTPWPWYTAATESTYEVSLGVHSDVMATRVSHAETPTAEIGDRVIIREHFNKAGTEYIGKRGTVKNVEFISGRYRYTVTLDGDDPTRLTGKYAGIVDKVEPATAYPAATAAVGDYVAILKTAKDETDSLEGERGKVVEVIEPEVIGGSTSPRVYVVRLSYPDGKGVDARAHKVRVKQQPTTEAASPAVDVLIDVKRAQAATFAHELLGEYPDLDDLLRIADYVLTDPTAADELKKLADAPSAPIPNSFTDLKLTDVDGDELHVMPYGSGVSVQVRTLGGSVNEVYVTGENFSRLAKYLEARRGSFTF